MRILFLSAEYPPETGIGGIGSYVASIVHPLAARGHEVHVLSCVSGQPGNDVRAGAVWIHRRGLLGDEDIWAWAQILNSWVTLPRVYTSVTCFVEARRLGVPFDVVEAPDWMAEGLLVGLLRRWPLVSHLHTGMTLSSEFNEDLVRGDGRWATRLERLAVARSHVVTSPSELLVRRLRATGWLGRGQVEIVRNPLDFGTWSGVAPAEATAPVVLTVGRLEPRKAQEDVIRALGRIARDVEGLEAVFVGDTERPHGAETYGSWLTSLAAEEGVACKLVGKIDREELRQWYGAARVVAVPSTFDNFPMAALEAMAAARPVVCTSATGTAELIAGTTAGRVVPPSDPGALAEALRPYLLDPREAGRAGREAREVAGTHCSPEGIAEERERVYRRAIRTWRSSASARLVRRPQGRDPREGP